MQTFARSAGLIIGMAVMLAIGMPLLVVASVVGTFLESIDSFIRRLPGWR